MLEKDSLRTLGATWHLPINGHRKSVHSGPAEHLYSRKRKEPDNPTSEVLLKDVGRPTKNTRCGGRQAAPEGMSLSGVSVRGVRVSRANLSGVDATRRDATRRDTTRHDVTRLST